MQKKERIRPYTPRRRHRKQSHLTHCHRVPSLERNSNMIVFECPTVEQARIFHNIHAFNNYDQEYMWPSKRIGNMIYFEKDEVDLPLPKMEMVGQLKTNFAMWEKEGWDNAKDHIWHDEGQYINRYGVRSYERKGYKTVLKTRRRKLVKKRRKRK